jgi:hypothetical protein
MCLVVDFPRAVMKNVSAENALRSMLAAWMLLATSATSSTFVHEHHGGSVAHEHGEAGCAPTHCHWLPDCADNHDGEVSSAAADVHRHGTLRLFGAVLPMPPSGPSGSCEKDFSGGCETIVALSAAPSVRNLLRGLAVEQTGSVSTATVPIGCVCETSPTAFSCARVAPVSFLCDRARHERSGVLLA